MQNAGVRAGDSLDMLYQAVQAPAYMGRARAKGRNIGADSNGSISDHVARMRREHQSVASGWLTEGATAQMTSYYRDPRLLSAPARKLLSQWQMSSGFGSQESFRSKPHEGNDYATPSGTKLSFKQAGVVVEAKSGAADRNSNGGYGGYIDVRLADGNVVRIGHLSEVLVRKGQRLRPKQIAALTGSTGRSTGPHAHIEHLSGPTGTEETLKGKKNPSWIASQVYADI
jgi:murein DD-endopeptidase MepM/ murein hydrolase activator NlpD